MRRPRPQTVAVVGLGALALGLALWWIAEIVEEPAPTPPGEPITPTWIVADEAEKPAADEPTLAPAQPPPAGRPPPRSKAVEPETPEMVSAPPSEGDGGEGFEDPEYTKAKKREKRGALPSDVRGRALDWRSGASGKTDASATREVAVPEGTAWIGTPLNWVQGLSRARGPETYPGLLYEAPRHPVKMHAFFMDRFEVKNHDYLRFLQTAHTVVYRTEDHDARSLVEIARALILEPPRNLDYADGVAWQLFQANKLALLKAFKHLVVYDKQDVIDEEKTYLRIREDLVPSGIHLTFFDAAPPPSWPSNIYLEGYGGHPVRGISLEEALAFAHWDGRHVPSEIQWEYAARGPRGFDYPWGGGGDKLETFVNGAKVFDRDEEPRTDPVANNPDGISWVGCFNMLGNVAEWTTSFLDPYPDGPRVSVPPPGRNLVVRGGSAKDEDPYLLRTAFRGWAAGDDAGGPLPNTRVPWTGFRTARHEAVGFSRTVAMHYLVRRDGRVDPSLIEPEIFEAWQGIQEEHFVRQFEDDLARPGVKSICIQPLAQVAVRPAGERRHGANPSEALTELETLRSLSFTSPVILGLFQTDLHLVSTWHASDSGSEHLFRARCPPGVWYVALFQGRIALIRTDFRDVFFVSNREAPKALFTVRELRTRPGDQLALPESTLTWQPGGADLKAEYESHLWQDGKRTWVARLELRLTLEAQEAAVVGNWEHGRRTERRP